MLALGAVPRTLADPRPRRARPLVQVARRRDQPPQPRPPPARGGRRSARRGGAVAAADVRLRRRRLRGRRGARRAVRPRRGRAPLLPAPALDAAPLGARRRSAADPARHPAAARRLRRGRAPQARTSRSTSTRRSSRSRPTRPCSATGRGSRRTRSSGRPASRRTPSLREWSLPLDEKGRVDVDQFLRVRGHEHVWALGDCARVPNTRSEQPDPPTCQHALRQARRLAKNLTGTPEPYHYRMLGQVATLGRHKGIAEVLGLRLRGFLGWWVTRSYHLYQLPLASEKVSGRRRLDGGALLPPRHRRARPARPSREARLGTCRPLQGVSPA